MDSKTIAKRAIERIKARVAEDFKDLASSWDSMMENGSVIYARACGVNIRRLHLGYAHTHIFPHLKADLSNLYEATCKAIEQCRPEQYSVRKGIKYAAISLVKFLIHQEENKCY